MLVAGATAAPIAVACGGKSESGSSGASGGTSGTSGGTSSGTSGTSSGTSGGTSGTSGTVVSGCGSPSTTTQKIDATKCEAQLASTTTCGGSVCSWTVVVPCFVDADGGDGGDASVDAGTASERCQRFCDPYAPPGRGPTTFCYESTGDAGAVTISCGGCGVGRPPRAFVARRSKAARADAERLAEIAQLEAASVQAFDALYMDLERHGAPRDLLRDVRAASLDEVRHARAMRGAAEARGAEVPEVEPLRIPARTLIELAVDNAEEGCVKETFGAALATMQARTARDARFRRTMTRIAHEETRHAALSWRIAAWLHERLDDAARARVETARAGAIAALEGELAACEHATHLPSIGLPDGATAREIFAAMRPALEAGLLMFEDSAPEPREKTRLASLRSASLAA